MQAMNKVMDPQKTAKMMQEFERENAKMGMSEEMSKYLMSLCVRKPTVCIGENKAADQLCSNCTADQRLCLRYKDSTILLLSEISSF